jgi:hypothetical protein
MPICHIFDIKINIFLKLFLFQQKAHPNPFNGFNELPALLGTPLVYGAYG